LVVHVVVNADYAEPAAVVHIVVGVIPDVAK
jgi:hypothetical protein